MQMMLPHQPSSVRESPLLMMSHPHKVTPRLPRPVLALVLALVQVLAPRLPAVPLRRLTTMMTIHRRQMMILGQPCRLQSRKRRRRSVRSCGGLGRHCAPVHSLTALASRSFGTRERFLGEAPNG